VLPSGDQRACYLTRRIAPDAEIVVVEANGAPAVALIADDDTVLVVPEFDGSLLRRLEIVVAPEKLGTVCATIGNSLEPR
jgi:hypothetical protein